MGWVPTDNGVKRWCGVRQLTFPGLMNERWGKGERNEGGQRAYGDSWQWMVVGNGGGNRW